MTESRIQADHNFIEGRPRQETANGVDNEVAVAGVGAPVPEVR